MKSDDDAGKDMYSPEKRSEIMSRIRSRDTKPERVLRSLLHRMGFRFRLHRRDLPGSPDIVLPKYKTAVFVHGCFWHQHPGCSRATFPNSRPAYWSAKFASTRERDEQAVHKLKDAGWTVVVVWECELKGDALPALKRLSKALPIP